MKKHQFKLLGLLIAVIIISNEFAVGQASEDANLPGFTTDYLGWDENTTIPLEIRHDGGQPIIFSTGPNDEERMRILPNGRIPFWNSAYQALGVLFLGML